jgi:phosphoglycerate dehydrogenase-like enzyme
MRGNMSENQRLLIALSWPATKEDVDRYQTYVSTNCKILTPKGPAAEELSEVAETADVILGGYVPAHMISSAKSLKMVQITHAGVLASHALDPDLDQTYLGFSLKMLKDRSILLGNIHANSVLVAEHALTLMFVLAKRILAAHAAISAGNWFPFTPENRSAMITGSTVGIVGLGAIGQEVAKRLKPFGARIIATKKTPSSELARSLGLDFLGDPDSVPKLLSESDFVILTVPLTCQTYHLIAERELRMMKRSAFLINVARAEIVDEGAIYRALVERWLSGFASDVWWFYGFRSVSREFLNLGYFCPVPSRLGVHRLANVVVTGDRACFTTTMEETYMRDALRNVDMLARGCVPDNLVDLNRLY